MKLETGRQKLSTKQEGFAWSIASGEFNSLSDAYRKWYKTENMAQDTIHQAASRAFSNSKVTARVLEHKAAIEARQLASVASDSDRILKKLRDLMDNAQGLPEENVQLRAAVELAKINDMYTLTVDDKRTRTAAEVRAELDQRLAALDETTH